MEIDRTFRHLRVAEVRELLVQDALLLRTAGADLREARALVEVPDRRFTEDAAVAEGTLAVLGVEQVAADCFQERGLNDRK